MEPLLKDMLYRFDFVFLAGPLFPPNGPTLSPGIPSAHGPRTIPLPGQANGPGRASSESGKHKVINYEKKH